MVYEKPLSGALSKLCPRNMYHEQVVDKLTLHDLAPLIILTLLPRYTYYYVVLCNIFIFGRTENNNLRLRRTV